MSEPSSPGLHRWRFKEFIKSCRVCCLLFTAHVILNPCGVRAFYLFLLKKNFLKSAWLLLDQVGGVGSNGVASVPFLPCRTALAKRDDEICRSLLSCGSARNRKTRAKVGRWKLLHFPLWRWIRRTIYQLTFCYQCTICWWRLFGLISLCTREFIWKITFVISVFNKVCQGNARDSTRCRLYLWVFLSFMYCHPYFEFIP